MQQFASLAPVQCQLSGGIKDGVKVIVYLLDFSPVKRQRYLLPLCLLKFRTSNPPKVITNLPKVITKVVLT